MSEWAVPLFAGRGCSLLPVVTLRMPASRAVEGREDEKGNQQFRNCIKRTRCSSFAESTGFGEVFFARKKSYPQARSGIGVI